jgi:hypothetical protein
MCPHITQNLIIMIFFLIDVILCNIKYKFIIKQRKNLKKAEIKALKSLYTAISFIMYFIYEYEISGHCSFIELGHAD